MPATALDDRRREVLRTLIQLHVDTGEPVGSESLSRAFGRALSPASLRSQMADLEALGYLDHPHTSAGRVPTDEGYRFYVDSLMGLRELAPGDAQAIAELRQARLPRSRPWSAPRRCCRASAATWVSCSLPTSRAPASDTSTLSRSATPGCWW